MDKWEKIKIISMSASSLLIIPIVLGFIGHSYTKGITEREVQGSFVPLAVNILQDEPTEENRNLRKWAIQVLVNIRESRWMKLQSLNCRTQ